MLIGRHANPGRRLVVLYAALAFVVLTALTGDLRWGLATAVAVGLCLTLARRPLSRLWVRSRTNDRHVVDTVHGTAGRIEAVEYFWRPG